MMFKPAAWGAEGPEGEGLNIINIDGLVSAEGKDYRLKVWTFLSIINMIINTFPMAKLARRYLY